MSLIYGLTRGLISNTTPSTPPATRYAPFFDGVAQYAVMTQRAIDPDGDIDIEWEQRNVNLGSIQNIVTQTDNPTAGSREFQLRWLNTGALNIVVGNFGQGFNSESFVSDGHFRVTLVGQDLEMYVNGALVESKTYARGTAREPLAPTRVCARNNSGTITELFGGVIYNLKINGVEWPMATRNNPVQTSIPAGNDMTIINHTDAMWQEVS